MRRRSTATPTRWRRFRSGCAGGLPRVDLRRRLYPGNRQEFPGGRQQRLYHQAVRHGDLCLRLYVNAGYPNDGTKAPSGPGYNGTTVVNTKLKDGDVVDFFFYADGDAYSDYYTWIDVPETMVTGEASP